MLLRLTAPHSPSLAWSRRLPAGAAKASGSRDAVRRLFALGLAAGATQQLDPLPGMTVHCRTGRLWITHDGESRDVVLQARESYTVDSGRTMRLHALDESGLEIQVDSAV